MPTTNRAALLTKTHKVLKKHYKPVPPVERPVLEHLLYACCLENATYESADKAYTLVSTNFFDWNEVRVSTVKELAEVMHSLPDPSSAASNLKRILQGVFESTYSFDLEALRKQNLGVAQQRLKKLEGCTNFAVAYVTQAVLGGHAIPIDRGVFDCLAVLGLVTEADRKSSTVPGMERAIAKNKGVEFGSLVHQLGAEFVANPYAPALHKILLEIAPDCKEHLPKKPPKGSKAPATAPVSADEAKKASQRKELKETNTTKESKEARPAAAPAPLPETAEPKQAAAKKRPTEPVKRPVVARKSEPGKPAVEAAHQHAKEPPEKSAEKKKSASAGLAKRKPR
jgi:endonuclease III